MDLDFWSMVSILWTTCCVAFKVSIVYIIYWVIYLLVIYVFYFILPSKMWIILSESLSYFIPNVLNVFFACIVYIPSICVSTCYIRVDKRHNNGCSCTWFSYSAYFFNVLLLIFKSHTVMAFLFASEVNSVLNTALLDTA